MSPFQKTASLALVMMIATSSIVSQDGPERCLAYWRSGELDSVRALLPVLYKKHASSTAARFFQAVFDQNGDGTVPTLESIAATNDPYAEECLIRLVQYQYAKGLYVGSRTRFEELARRYPDSRWLATGTVLLGRVDSTQTVVTSTGSGRFSIQAGAFGVQNNAIELQKKLEAMGLSPVTLQEKTVKSRTLFVVRVGSFATREEAESVSRDLRSKGVDNSIIEN